MPFQDLDLPDEAYELMNWPKRTNKERLLGRPLTQDELANSNKYSNNAKGDGHLPTLTSGSLSALPSSAKVSPANAWFTSSLGQLRPQPASELQLITFGTPLALTVGSGGV